MGFPSQDEQDRLVDGLCRLARAEGWPEPFYWSRGGCQIGIWWKDYAPFESHINAWEMFLCLPDVDHHVRVWRRLMKRRAHTAHIRAWHWHKNPDRNEAIYQMIEAGESQKDAAGAFGIAVSGAHKIYWKYKKRDTERAAEAKAAARSAAMQRAAYLSRIQDPDDVQQTYKGHWTQASWI